MKHLKKFNEDVYYERPRRNDYYKVKINDEQALCLEQQINADFSEHLGLKEEFYISSIHWYNWDNEEKWFVFMVNMANLEKQSLKDRIKEKGADYTVRNRRGVSETLGDRLKRLNSESRYKEFIIKKPEIQSDRIYCSKDNIEQSSHGFPVQSEELWVRPDDLKNRMKYLSKYNIFENVQQSKAFLQKKSIPENHKDYLYLKNMLQNNIGYLFWFVKMHFDQSIPLTELQELYSKIKSNPVVFNNLPKNIIEYDTYEKILDDIIKSEKDIQYKKVVNELLPFQKKWLEDGGNTLRDLLYLISGRKDYKNFFKKISAYKSVSELRKGLSTFLNSSEDNSFGFILKSINNCGAKLIYSNEQDNIIICEVNYEQIKALGGDTSWCIDYLSNY